MREALLRHQKLGQPVVVWSEGRVIEIPPERIPAELERAERELRPSA